MAVQDVDVLKKQALADPSALLPAQYKWLEKNAVRNYKDMDKAVPSPMTVRDALTSFATEQELRDAVETRYRDEILKAKNLYTNSVKLGLDLSGGMNVIVKADLDAALAARDPADSTSEAEFKKEAMNQALETLQSRIDRFGLSEPVIRLQGEDRIYIELPGAAETDRINSIIMGKGILNFRLVDMDATNAFMSAYSMNPSGMFDAEGNLINSEVIPADCEVLGLYTKDAYGLDERISYLVVKKEIAMDGQHIKSAQVGSDNLTGKPQVNFILDSEGTQIFGDFTSAHVGDSLAIVSDDKIKSYLSLSEEEKNRNRDKISSLLEEKCFSGGKRSLLRRKIELSVSGLVTAAAALVFVFIGGFMFFGTSDEQTGEILPSFAVQAGNGSVRYVSDAASLDNFTLEEILHYLDSKGYNVDISIKGLQPLEMPESADQE